MTIQLAITMGSDIIFPVSMQDQLPDRDLADYMLNPGPINDLLVNYEFFQNYMGWLLGLGDLTYEEKTNYLMKISLFVDNMNYTLAGGSGVLDLSDDESVMADRIVEFFKDFPTCTCTKLA